MTPDAFLDSFARALACTHAEVLTAVPTLYPRGPLLRFKVVAGWHVKVPPLLDPIGLVWFASQGSFHGVEQSYLVAVNGLRMTREAAISWIEASDYAEATLAPLEATRRRALLDVVEAYRTELAEAERARVSPQK